MTNNFEQNSKILNEIIASIVKNKLTEKSYNEESLRRIIFSDLKKLNHSDRENIAADMVQKLSVILAEENIKSSELKSDFSEDKINKHLSELNENGITLLGEVLSPAQVKEIHEDLKNKPTFNGHVWDASDKKEYSLEEVKENHPQSTYLLKDILGAPHLLETMSNPNIVKIAEKYLKIVPKLYASNLMWSFGKHHDPKKGVARVFHRDIDNFDFCVLFIFLTDVKKGSGSHQYIRKTHKLNIIKKLLVQLKDKLSESDYETALNYLNSDKLGAGYVDNEVLPLNQIEELFKDEMLEVEGKAGHAFLADPYGLHRGVPVISDDRLLFWGRFAIYDNGFSSSSGPEKLDWKNFENRIEKNSYNKYMLDSILAEKGDDKSLHSPDIKRLKENVFIGNASEISTQLRKSLGTKEYIKNFISSLVSKKK